MFNMSIPGARLNGIGLKPYKRLYIQVKHKFLIANVIALVWFLLSYYISCPWIEGLAKHLGSSLSWFAVMTIALIPGYLNMFLLISLFLDRPPSLSCINSFPAVTLLIAAYNEEKCIAETINSISQQDYKGELEVIIVDDGSTDRTRDIILNSGMKNLRLILAKHRGKAAALNSGLKEISNEFTITIDADTFLHPQAVTRIMKRIISDPLNTAAVAGCVLAKNSRESFMTRLQEWDYFMAIASVKRQQSLYQGTLVAQGSFSVYRTEAIKKINGWPECIGEDIVLTWALIKAGYRIGFESSAIGFTEVPSRLKGFARQRRRWARGMIEGFKNHIDVLYKKRVMAAYLIALDLLFPVLDFSYTFIYIPGVILALLGFFWIAGPMTLAVLPVSVLINYVMYRNQRKVFSELDLRIRKNKMGLILYTLIYQMLLSPVCVWGYAQEMTGYAKKW